MPFEATLTLFIAYGAPLVSRSLAAVVLWQFPHPPPVSNVYLVLEHTRQNFQECHEVLLWGATNHPCRNLRSSPGMRVVIDRTGVVGFDRH